MQNKVMKLLYEIGSNNFFLYKSFKEVAIFKFTV